MKNFKRYLVALIVLIIIFIIVYLCVHFLSKGYTHTYKIDNYSIKEIYTKDEQYEDNNYYIEINANNILYNYQFSSIKDDNKIVKEVLYYDGEYKCLMPVLSDNIKVDFLCYKDKSYYNYVDIKGKDEKLDKYIKKLDNDKYNVDNFIDKNNKEEKDNKIIYYKENIPKTDIISMTTLKGIVVIIDGKLTKIDMFNKDIYERDLCTYAKNYYVCANYENKQVFNEVVVANTITGKIKNIKTPDYISFDSYIQGVVDNDIYIYDYNSEVQYKINLEDSEVTIVGDSNKGIKYYNGNWSSISAVKANGKIPFKDKRLKKENTYYIYHTGNKLSGYYYSYFESDNEEDIYEIYRAHSQNKKIKKYIAKTNDYKDIIYLGEYIYFRDGNKIKIYSDYTGVKTVINNNELEFNNNIEFTVYQK